MLTAGPRSVQGHPNWRHKAIRPGSRVLALDATRPDRQLPIMYIMLSRLLAAPLRLRPVSCLSCPVSLKVVQSHRSWSDPAVRLTESGPRGGGRTLQPIDDTSNVPIGSLRVTARNSSGNPLASQPPGSTGRQPVARRKPRTPNCPAAAFGWAVHHSAAGPRFRAISEPPARSSTVWSFQDHGRAVGQLLGAPVAASESVYEVTAAPGG